MKGNINLRTFVAIAAFGLGACPVLADLEVSTSVQIHAKADFEAPLAAHGAWVEVGSHGRCWRPAQVGVGWRPYGAGQWVWTDCGWYWSSEEPWAWACYHYGGWVCDPSFGWVWVPHVEWAPARVSWRAGGGFIGWAPLPPPGLVFTSHPRAELFVFVGEGRLCGRVRPGTYIVNDSVIFKKTSQIGGIKGESRSLGGSGAQKVMVNHGPRMESVQAASGKKFAAVPIRDAAARSPGPTPAKHTLADARSGRDQERSRAEGRAERPPDQSRGPRPDAVKAGPDRGSSPGGFGGPMSGRGNGGRSGGGGRGKH